MGDTPTRREVIAQAIQQQKADAAEAETEAPVATETTETTSGSTVSEESATPEPKAEAQASATGRARDEKGRYTQKAQASPDTATTGPAKKAEAADRTPPPGTDSAASATPKVDALASNATTIKAPQSWTPLEREEFGKLPKVAQEAVLRREAEHQKFVQESAEHRNGYQAFQKVIGPYEGLIRSRGGEPLPVVEQAVRAYVGLHTAPPQTQAQMVANMVRGLKIPIDMLDAALSGEAQPQAQQPQFDPVKFKQELQQDWERKRLQEDLASWSQGKEHYGDVADVMAGILDAHARAGKPLTKDQAYEMACRAHPEVASILGKREAEKKAEEEKARAQKLRAAASSIRTSPAVVQNGAVPKSRRDLIAKLVRGEQ